MVKKGPGQMILFSEILRVILNLRIIERHEIVWPCPKFNKNRINIASRLQKIENQRMYEISNFSYGALGGFLGHVVLISTIKLSPYSLG
jgi:hypothetical protein